MRWGRRQDGGFILVCPCETWQVEVPREVIEVTPPFVLRDIVDEALLAHEAECIVLAATHIAAEAARD